MRVLGTAGHVDHGKSTLVQALTGIHPDRLKEEREREMTIDLGFAWLELPGGEEVGIIDVPGHRDFIENMLAGVGGIDAALLVIAADEGVMPQTREHLAILDLLQIKTGVVALTKVDLVEDPDWLALVEEDVRRALQGTVLANAPLVRVSARTRQGLDSLLEALHGCLAEVAPRPDYGRPRLPVDRVFSMPGFGTVVTGTLSDGRFQVGDEVEARPGSARGRIRGLQTHKKKEEYSVPGSRTAMNISGIAVGEVERGAVIVHPGDYQPTRRLDVRCRLLPDATQPLEHDTQVKLYLGSAEVLARVRVLGNEALAPGETGWLQLEPVELVVAARGDRYILRRPSPGETLGGGVVVNPHPKSRHKRFSTAILTALDTMAQGSPGEILAQGLAATQAVTVSELLARTGLDEGTALPALKEVVQSGEALILEGNNLQANALLAGKARLEGSLEGLLAEVSQYHAAYPLRRGMPRQELKSRSHTLAPRAFNALLSRLVAEGRLLEQGPLVMLPGSEIHFSTEQETVVAALLKRFRQNPAAPPSVKECKTEVGDEVYAALLELGLLVQVSQEVVFLSEEYQRMVEGVRKMIAGQGVVTAAQVRDHFDTSRKYVLALLEHLDGIGVTVREGDLRRLRAPR